MDEEVKSSETRPADGRALIGYSIMHAANDLHTTFLPTFLPEMVRNISMNMAQAGMLSTIFGLLNLIVQPAMGRVADRLRGPVLALFAPIVTALGACMLLLAPNYAAAAVFVVIMGLGTASFHPQGFGRAGSAAGSAKLGSFIAIFTASGTLGAALSPMYGIALFSTLGPVLMPAAVLLPIGLSVIASRLVRDHAHAPRERSADDDAPFFSSIAHVAAATLPLMLIAIIRDSTTRGITVFLPLLITGRGGTIAAGGTMLFAFTVAQSVANLAGGRLADAFGHKRVIIVMLAAAPCFLLPAVLFSGWLSMVLFIGGGICIAATNPITLAMAQERVPGSRSTASSFVMGVAWGIANIVASPIGMLADRIGLGPTLAAVALAPFAAVSLVAAIELRDRAAKRRADGQM